MTRLTYEVRDGKAPWCMAEPHDAALSESRRWLRWAREDLMLAQHALADPEVVRRGSCTWAHQAAEKALKALLVSVGSDPPKVHWPLAAEIQETSP